MNHIVSYFLILIMIISCSKDVKSNANRYSFNEKEIELIRVVFKKNSIKKGGRIIVVDDIKGGYFFGLSEMRKLLESDIDVVLDVLFSDNLIKKRALDKKELGCKGLEIKTLKHLRMTYLKRYKNVEHMNKRYFMKKQYREQNKWIYDMITKFGKKYIKNHIIEISAILLSRKYQIIGTFEKVVDDHFISLMKYLRFYINYFKYFECDLELLSKEKCRDIMGRIKLFIKILNKIEGKLYRHISDGYLSREKAKMYYNLLDLDEMKKFIGNIEKIGDIFSIVNDIRRQAGISSFFQVK